jgi:cell division protease FtsH
MLSRIKPWMLVAATLMIGVVLMFQLQARTRITRSSTEAAMILEQVPSFLIDERDSGAFVHDLRGDEVALLGEATNMFLVERTDGTRYFVFKSDSIRGALEHWVDDGGRLYALKQSINPILDPAGRLSQVGVAVLTSGPVISVLLFGGLFLLLGQRLGLMPGSTPFLKVDRPVLRFSDIVGVSEAKRELLDLTHALSSREDYTRVSARPPRGVLLSGPPGTGKTLLAKALAGESGASFIAVDGSSFTDKFVGIGVQRVRQLFEAARKNSPCVVFIDEIDGVGRRSSQDDSVSQENNRVINALLTEIDGFGGEHEIIVLAATNHPENVDKALLREGRFDRKCVLTLPGLSERSELFARYADALPLDPSADFHALGRRTIGLAPAAIASIVGAAARFAAREGAAQVTMAHFERAVSQQQLGAPSPEVRLSEGERWRTAYHEAGHAIIAHLEKVGTVEKVTILPHSRALGVTVMSPSEERHIHSRSDLEREILMLLGGRAAELLVYGSASTGAANDLERVSSLAYRMVAEYGFSERCGPFSLAGLHGLVRDIPQAGMDAIQEARDMLMGLESRCIATLTEHRVTLNELAGGLMERETLDEVELTEMFERMTDLTEMPRRQVHTTGARGRGGSLANGSSNGPQPVA